MQIAVLEMVHVFSRDAKVRLRKFRVQKPVATITSDMMMGGDEAACNYA